MRLTLLTSVFALTVASVGPEQTWRELYDSGQYVQVAAILHPLVLEGVQSAGIQMPDVDATETLARLYLEGKGVLQDAVVACSFAHLASSAAMFRYHTEAHPVMARIRRLEASACDTLSDDDRTDAGQMIGCPRYGPDRQVFALDTDHSLEVSRSGVRIEYRGQQYKSPLPSFGCPQRSVLVRHTRIDPGDPSAAVPVRHLLELFGWTRAGSSRQQTLVWQLVEIVGGSLEWRAMQQFADRAGSPWSSVSVPVELADVSFEVQRTGEIDWKFHGTAFRGVLPALPETQSAEAAPRLPTTGGARVDVTVVDRFGAPLVGAAVRLSGVVLREALTNEAGGVQFEDLPDGRYDIVGSAKELAGSLPRVLNLSAQNVTAVALTLKPYARGVRSTIACGGFDSRSITGLAQGADLVVHVKIVGQETSELPPADADATGDLRTVNQVQVLQSFKSTPLSPAPNATMTVVQGGGRLDRGDYIDAHQFNRLAPLNVGDEYVLFLTTASDALWIHGSEEGAFRIRNGRVEPLGQGGAADAWSERAPRAFFEALQTKINADSVSRLR